MGVKLKNLLLLTSIVLLSGCGAAPIIPGAALVALVNYDEERTAALVDSKPSPVTASAPPAYAAEVMLPIMTVTASAPKKAKIIKTTTTTTKVVKGQEVEKDIVEVVQESIEPEKQITEKVTDFSSTIAAILGVLGLAVATYRKFLPSATTA